MAEYVCIESCLVEDTTDKFIYVSKHTSWGDEYHWIRRAALSQDRVFHIGDRYNLWVDEQYARKHDLPYLYQNRISDPRRET